MGKATKLRWVICCFVLCIALGFAAGRTRAETGVEPTTVEDELKLEEKVKEQEKIKVKKKIRQITPEEIAQLTFPEDTSPLVTIRELHISGNILITTEELFQNIPLVYNASDAPLKEAESSYLYDFRKLRDVIEMPGQPQQISTRTIRGLTQCILSMYRNKGYSGIYVYVPSEALQEGKRLEDDILPVKVIEAPVTQITTSFYNPENMQVEKGYLSSSSVLEWSPVQPGEVGNEKELSNFVNLLNLNPDRYISATVSKGAEPDTLALSYNIYEANPWHWFFQIDNSGTKDRQWAPRVGLINTNLTARDDTLTVFHQASWDSDFDENYSIYGSYDFPLTGPELRLNLYASYSEFDVAGGGGIDFLGNGAMYGGQLRYNFFQTNGWFFDFTTSLSHEKSKVSSSIFSAILGSKVHMDLWGVGLDIHRRDDMTNTSIGFDRVQSVGGSKQRKFWDTSTLTGARTEADRDFSIYTTSANHSRYLDTDKIQRLSGSFRWIIPNERLVPAKMTAFGGMYSVRGYKESKIVADGGILASVQYEYDLVKYDKAKEKSQATAGLEEEEETSIRKLAPLAFFDCGLAKMKDAVVGEDSSQHLYSIGIGTLAEIGDNFSGALYYGYPLKATDTTDRGDGRLHVSLMMRW